MARREAIFSEILTDFSILVDGGKIWSACFLGRTGDNHRAVVVGWVSDGRQYRHELTG